ncbi:MAG: aminodeoxychorismate synthase component I [Novosphingobium sp.]|nr:aminodeoxychorismate synthase component I [Novosphingobium sp.]
MAQPFILLDDARPGCASNARLYRDPVELIVAHRPGEVEPALARMEALNRKGLHLAGYITYEAGMVLEPRLAELARAGTGANGPLVWFGAFRDYKALPADGVEQWLMDNSDRSVPAAIGPLVPQISFSAYRRAFERLNAAIRAGDIYQANLTFPLAGSWRGDPLAIYAAIRPAAAAGHGGILHDGAQWLLSFSPELFFLLRDGLVMVRPMKGTRPRSSDPEQDRNLAAELLASAKDRAENLMIIDLMRNDLARVSLPGSVRVEGQFTVETYPRVHQMVSTALSRIQPGKGALDVLRALFPCGSVTGAPKIRAMELIHEVERDPRGVYCGAIGRIDAGGPNGTGEAAFNVAIRTMRLRPEGEGGGRAEMGVGSAIVADSQALCEWRECLIKGGFVQQSVGPASAAGFDLLETMAFTPDSGIPLLALHLERIGASAALFGFSFDRHAVRNAIQALCFDADQPARLRLAASRTGTFCLELSEMPESLPVPAICALMPLPVDPGDWRLAHKTTDRDFYETGLAAAREAGAHEAIFLRDDGLVTEGCFTNIFVEREGMLLTPPARLGLLPGVLRRSLIDQGLAREAELTADDLANGFLIGNALRGLIPARLLMT